MWTSELSDCWLNTPDVRTSDDDDGPPSAAPVTDHDDHILDEFGVVAESPQKTFHHTDVTFQTAAAANDPFSPATSIPLPVLEFYDIEAPLVDQLVTPPVLTKTVESAFSAASTRGSSVVRSDADPSSSTAFSSPLSDHHQEQFVLIQLNTDDLISILSHATNNNEFVVNNISSPIISRRRRHSAQHQQRASKHHISTTTAAALPSTGYHAQQQTSSEDKTGSDVTRLSEDVLRMLDDAESIVVGRTLLPLYCLHLWS